MAAKLTEDDLDFLARVREGQRLLVADREQDRVRQKCRRMGLVRVEMDPRRWTITDAGRTALSQHQGGTDGR